MVKELYKIEDFGAVFDAHVHTYFDFHDGMISPRDLVKYSRKWGFNWINAMAHDTIRGLSRIKKIARENNMPVIPSMEVSTGFNHLLAFGVQEWKLAKDSWSPEEIIERLRSQDCAIFASHPAINPFQGYWTPEIIERLDLDGIEWLNGSNTFLNKITRKKFANYPKGKIGGSDAHHVSQMGYSYTQVGVNSEDPDDLVSALKKGKCQPRGNYVPLHRIGAWEVYINLKRHFFPSFQIENRWIWPQYQKRGQIPSTLFSAKQWKKKILSKPKLIN